MRPLFLTALLGLTLCVFTGCSDSDQPHPKKPGFHPPGDTQYPPEPTPPPSGDDGNGPPPNPSAPTPTPDEQQPAAPVPSPSPLRKDYPYGVPVPGKTGFVTSPYMPGSGYVDVRGYPPGTEVKDPYSQKIFLVP